MIYLGAIPVSLPNILTAASSSFSSPWTKPPGRDHLFLCGVIFLLIKRTFNRLKILGSGDLKTKLNIEADFVSKSAKIKLDKLGCSVSIKTIS